MSSIQCTIRCGLYESSDAFELLIIRVGWKEKKRERERERERERGRGERKTKRREGKKLGENEDRRRKLVVVPTVCVLSFRSFFLKFCVGISILLVLCFWGRVWLAWVRIVVFVQGLVYRSLKPIFWSPSSRWVLCWSISISLCVHVLLLSRPINGWFDWWCLECCILMSILFCLLTSGQPWLRQN